MSMLSLVSANGLLQVFISWELVGLSSYLLIGFWYEKFSASEAGKKAFVVTRFGDIGFFMGLINFAGFYSFLKALSMGPLSIIASIIGMHFVIVIVLSALIYKEKLTRYRILGICLTIVSIILLRL